MRKDNLWRGNVWKDNVLRCNVWRGNVWRSNVWRGICSEGVLLILVGITLECLPPPSPGSVILGNRGLKVPRGSWVYLDPVCDLVTRVLPGDRCYITVFDYDRAVIPGTLTPKKFLCAFGKGQVKYAHFGSKVITRDTVRLQVRYDTQTDTLVIPLTLEVEVTANDQEVVTTNTPLIVSELDGISNAINVQSLGIPFSGSSFGSGGSVSQCKLTLLIGTGGFPRHGTLVNYITNGQPTDCDAFVNMDVRYKFTPTSDSPYVDYIPMLAELLDKHGRGITNSPPRPSFLAMMMMEVDQFVMKAITSDMLAAEDAESASDDLVFNILTTLAPDQGDIISTDDQNQPITSFCQRDVKDLKIAYRPPAERIIHVELEVVDSDGVTSERFSFMIVVKPMNTLAPVVTSNTGQMLFKGQSRPLSSNHNLRISDEDNLSDVRITVLRGCQHGVLTVLGSPLGSQRQRKFFTPAELDSGVVVYEHDGSKTFSDNILFRMTDGRFDVDFLFPVTIVATDDEAPVINVNTGLILSRKETKMISSVALSATDVDSDVSTVKQSHPPVDLTGWTFNTTERVYECVVTEWLQRDITEGRVFYQHTGPRLTSAFTDQLVFHCQDDNVPPNQSGDNMFLVRIHPVDDLAPEPFPGSTLVLTVKEYQLTPIQKTCLHFTDLDSDDRDLRYIIVIPPTNTDQNNPTPLGHIVLTDNPNVVVTEFTQAQVNHLKVAYKPPDLELGTTPRVVQFTFIVKDTVGHSVDGIFTINLQPVDNKPPVTNTGVNLNINVKNTYVFTKDVLDATDQDTSADNITFIVTQVPRFGVLRCVGVDLVVWNNFTLADIHRGVVVYIHRGNGPGSDVVKVDVSDGYHKVPVTIRINIVTPAVMATPPMAPPTPGELHIIIEVNENGQIQIAGDKVQVSRRMHVDDLTFLIEQPPRFGVVQVQGALSDRLTLRDIIDGQVTYVHTSGEIGPGKHNDTFTLTMIGPWISGGNRVIQKVKVQVSILPVDSVPPILRVRGLLKVTEGEKKVVTVENIRVEDSDTDADAVLCTILVQPTFGYLEITSPSPGSEKPRAGIAVTAFHFRDVRLGNVVYVQSIHKGTEPVEDRTTLQCSDGINQSEISILTVVIFPDNDEEPQVFTREFVVMEGMSLTVNVPILNVVDLDVPGDVLEFEVVVPPKHGNIVQHLATGTVIVVTFTLDQIRTGSTIVYEHDGSETRHDNFLVKVTDGKHVVEKKVVVVVIPVDDETPRLAINNGLEVEFSEWKVITNKILKATDLDSEDRTLIKNSIKQKQCQGVLKVNRVIE
uniref:FRAS1-related extracellular matrix protein N-terminal domain-containing protein n=1 Tax=Hucho hucho TaxID=62062 RepID=A0A4W5KA39_9TELE